MVKDINYRMKENWKVTVTAKREVDEREKPAVKEEPTFKFEFQISTTYSFIEIKGLAKTIVSDRLGVYWKVTDVSLEMADYGV